MNDVQVKRAIISVSDKSGLAEFASGLASAGVEIFSTGGTRAALEAAGIAARDIAEYTGFPEMMDGRVKTLHPKIFAGILARRDRSDDCAALSDHNIAEFDLVVVNLYPFAETIAQPGVTLPQAIEQIDIGGPSLVRAAAKNQAFVAIATSSAQYPDILQQLSHGGTLNGPLRRRLAAEAFEHTAKYDRMIADYLAGQLSAADETPNSGVSPEMPETISLSLRRQQVLRYGENPHQSAAVYQVETSQAEAEQDDGTGGRSLLSARQINGKELSYNNLLDLDAALAIVRGFSPTPAVAVIKHNNPCGAASGTGDLADVARAALDGDPLSAFGSILAFNCPVDAATAEVLTEPNRFIEAIAAPSFEPDGLAVLTTRPKWKANVRLLECGQIADDVPQLRLLQVDGGFLGQTADTAEDSASDWEVPTNTKPTDEQLAELRFAWQMVRHVKSNAIVLSRNCALVGVGAGQMSRVDSVKIAIEKSAERSAGCVLASDAFFPFADSIETAAVAGVSAIIQPGGSRRDDEVIAACDAHGLPMIFTGCRHFRH
ncbi:MAG: bifunctional phosphoribosylaminoimidazolecarboxamide formyltransferase/IMP cyclohydrolase [Pirellulales bacterium]|nr:bifunctional phosphoribosylaminoimidazolecarboxamide formyltransferase/IMP cyclohydrolase [Pirellulales bacterium]